MAGQGSLIRLQLKTQPCIKVYFIHLPHSPKVEFVIQFFLPLFVAPKKRKYCQDANGYNGKLMNGGTER